MKTMNFILGVVSPAIDGGSKTSEMNSLAWYAFGALIALFIFAYLMYSLIKPEKF
jgi:K+-transporting ATPase KdpF subunit